MAFFPKNIFHISNTYNFEGKFLGYWIEIFGYWKIVFGSIASYFYYFPLSVSYRYGNLYRPIPITIPIRHFPYRQNRYICRYRYIGRYRYRNCIGRTLIYRCDHLILTPDCESKLLLPAFFKGLEKNEEIVNKLYGLFQKC